MAYTILSQPVSRGRPPREAYAGEPGDRRLRNRDDRRVCVCNDLRLVRPQRAQRSSGESWHGACVCVHAASHPNGSPRSRTSPHGGASEESKTTAGYGYRGPNKSLGDGRKAAPPPARRETTPGTMAWCHFNPVSEGASGPGVHIPRRWQHGDEPLARTLSPAAALLVCDNRQKLGENPVGPPSRGRPRAWVRVDRCLLQERPTPGASEGGAHHAERNF